ncbi:MAG TPA: FHA domain-containing protein [Gemmataceae bacterium]|nr:FHA domain-containing protein [Gemmataceae bacterium]
MPPEGSLITVWHPPGVDPGLPPGVDPGLPPGVRIPLPVHHVFIGRYGPAEGVHLTLRSYAVSRYHACLRAHADGWRLCDLDSRNRTFLNRAEVAAYEDRPLADGDVISICDHAFLFATESFDRRWLSADVVPLARGILDDGAWDRLGMLGDALVDAGCDWGPLLQNCSASGNLVIGRWALYYLLREAGEFDPVPSPLVADVDDGARPARFGPLELFEHIQPSGAAAGV